MRNASNLLIATSWISACITAAAQVDDKNATAASPRPQPAKNRTAEALRREAEAEMKRRDDEFARLKALRAATPPPAALQLRNLNRIQPGPHRRVSVGRGVVLLFTRLQEDGGGHDEDTPEGPRYLVDRDTFDLNVFGSHADVEPSKARLKVTLANRIGEIDWDTPLTPTEKQKLLLAGHGDIKRLLDKIEAQRIRFEGLRTDLDQCQELLVEVLPLKMSIVPGPFGDGSLFAKTLKRIREERNLVRK